MRYIMMTQILLLAAVAGCSRTTGGATISLTDRDWSLTRLGGSAAPTGAGDRPATLRLEGDKAGGFGGCNRYGGSYRLAGDSLSFGEMASTRMFCQEGSELEQKYLAILPLVRRYRIEDSTLTLFGDAGELARYRAQ
jgi:heat shock protein HslJ